MIRARCYSDDRRIEVKFDATPWFAKATNDEITSLSECGFGGDYAADEVAIWMANHDDEIARMFQYIEAVTSHRHREGFECFVDEESATAWVKANRPYLIVNGHVRMEPWGPKDWSPVRRSPKKKK